MRVMNLPIRCLSSVVACVALSAQAQETEPETSALQEVIVSARKFLSETSVSATKLAQPIAETPQSIAVLDEKLFQDLGLQDYVDSLGFVPGVQVTGDWGNFPTVYSRGYEIDGSNGYKINGTPLAGAKPLDNIAVERLELVRGSSGTTFGEGGPGGFVNLITRRPGDALHGEVNAKVGSFDRVRGEAAVTGPLNAKGSIRGYLSGAYERAGSHERFAKSTNRAAYGALDVDLTERARLNFIAYRSDNRNGPFHDGWPAVFDADGPRFPEELPDDTYTGAPWSFDDLEFEYYRGAFSYQFSPALNFELIGGYSDIRNPSQLADVCCSVSTPDLQSEIYYLFVVLDSSAKVLESRLSGSLPFLDGQVRYLASAEYRTRETVRQDSDYAFIAPYDLRNPVFDLPNPGADLSREELIVTTAASEFDIYSGSFTAILEPVERLSLTLGARYDRFTPIVQTYDGDFAVPTSRESFEDDNWLLRGAAMYELLPKVRAYYSYGETFEINTAPTCTGDALPPETGRSHEVGVKAQLSDQLLLTVAGYRIRTENNVQPLDFTACPDVTLNPSEPGEGQRSEGAELELSGSITPAWNILFGYAHTETRIVEDGVRLSAPGVPRDQVSLFTVYDFLTGPLTGIGFGGGFTYLSARDATFGGPGQRLRFDEQLRADLALYYRPSKRWSFALNMQNVFDERHPVSALQSTEFQNMWLAPRTISLSVDVDL